jgi:hypothetical protein
MKKISGIFLLSLAIATFAGMSLTTVTGCGGGGSTPTPTPVITNPPRVSPASVSVPIGGTQQFTAVNFSGPVTWSINPQVGSIDTTGLYHAPASFPAPNNLTVTASSAGTTVNASAAVVYPNDNAGAQPAPIKLGTSGANILDVGTKVCCIGTLGSLWTRGTGTFILSNNHVLARSDQAATGEAIQQPGQAACFASDINVANLTQKSALAPAGTTQGRTGPAPSNVDAAIAQVIPGEVDTAGTILDLGAAGASSIAAAPPSSIVATPTLGMNVAKSGRTTGLTCSSISSVSANIQIAYETSCGSNVTNFNAIFTNQVVINGGSFSAGGDSGSLIVTTAQARPVALLYGGSPTDTVANPIQDVITTFTNGSGPLTPVGGADHAVSCVPTTTAGAQVNGAASATVPLSAEERRRVTAVQQSRTVSLMKDAAITAVTVGASADNPGEGALVINASRALATPIPPVIDGVRTRIVFAEGSGMQPQIGQIQIDRATAVKEAHVSEYLGKPGIQGVGVSISSDDPAETAISFYVIQGEEHPPIPQVIDGVRTKIFEGARFKAY